MIFRSYIARNRLLRVDSWIHRVELILIPKKTGSLNHQDKGILNDFIYVFIQKEARRKIKEEIIPKLWIFMKME